MKLHAERASITEYLLALGSDDDLAIIDGTDRITFRDLRSSVARTRTALSSMGLPDGARVGIMASNSAFWIATYLAIMTRYVAVPLSDKLTIAEILRQAEFADCKAIALDRRHQRTHADALPGIPILSEDQVAHAAPELLPAPTVDQDADAALMFTSGTTAQPKAVRVTHRNLRANTESIITFLGLRSSDRVLVVLPFNYCYGASLLHTHLRAGASLVLCNTFAFPETAIAMLAAERCTEFAGVPSTYQLLLRASSFVTRDLPDLRLLQQAGGKLSPVMIEELVAAKPAARLFVMYGQTEATARLSYVPPELLAEKMGSVGRGIPGVRLEVVDEHGAPVLPGGTGEIVATGANISPGYLNNPEASAARFVGGRLRTGDLARCDDDGFIYIVDRLDDFIKTWGYRVSSQEIEACALRCSALIAAAAIGVADKDAGEAIELFVVARPDSGLVEAEILQFLRQNLAKHMVPRRVHFLAALPLNGNGKVTKAALRADAAQLADASPVSAST